MTTITIDESALESMESLLGEQFPDTLQFCCAEFERLSNEVHLNITSDLETALRNAHSLKSNAAQFGATSLSEVARGIELSLGEQDVTTAILVADDLSAQVAGSQAKLKEWLAGR
ncbi:Hpt domain-containing protein [Pseudoalteromonas mariniglutinosa]|uniref:Hpt domain-containing protein n=1 Tax=Pseudoalteromonas mariniglutinosa TaxID=206042 RepID=UPI00384E29F6